MLDWGLPNPTVPKTGPVAESYYPFPIYGNTDTQQQAPAVATGTGGTTGTGTSGNWWDLGFGSSSPMQFSAPTVSAPRVQAPKYPETPEVIPNYFGQFVQAPQEGEPVSELAALIQQITGREVSQAPVPKVDDQYINQLLGQYGIQPKSPEEIQEHARAIVDRQRYSQEQVIMREIDRFERDFPNEFRQVEKMLTDAASAYSAQKQEEMSARGMFYSSIMSSAVESVDRELVQILGDIARDAANRVSDMRADIRDLAQWAVLEEEVIRREIEEVEDAKRRQLMAMHLEVATWADQMALDAWYRQETLQLNSDQVQLQAIQLQMQEAERMGQHLANAFMADHPLVQQSMINMGITPEQFAGMSLEQQSAMVTSLVTFNDVEQQMRARELQMRAVIAEIQLQNAALQLQASIANAQFSMEAQKLSLTHMMHQDQMSLDWARFGLDVRMAEWQMSQPRGGVGTSGPTYNADLAKALNIADMYGPNALPYLQFELNQAQLAGDTAAVNAFNQVIRRISPAPSPSGGSTGGATIQQSSWQNFLDRLTGGNVGEGLASNVQGRTGWR